MIDLPDTIALSEFVPEVAVVAAGAPADMLESYIRQSAIDFTTRAQVLMRDSVIDLQAGVDEYPIRVSPDEQIVSMQYMGPERSACDCPPYSACGVPARCGGVATFKAPDRVILSQRPISDAPSALWVRVSVAPSRDACSIDRVLYDRYHEGVVNGALARVLLLKGMPWFDAALATFHRRLAGDAISAAGLDRLTRGERGPFKMKPRRVV